MKIQSSHSGNYIEFEDYPFDNSLLFIIKAKLGQFSGVNNEVNLLNITSFVKELNDFVTDRTLVPKLTGSHGFELSFYSKKAIGHPWVKVTLCDYAPTDNEDDHDPLFCVSGEFEVNHEYLNAYLEFFRTIA